MLKQESLKELLKVNPKFYHKYVDETLIPESFKTHDKLLFRCPEHGLFRKRLYYAKGTNVGCKKCVTELSRAGDKVIRRCIEKFGDQYSYDKVTYVSKFTPVTITCKDHGDFKQLLSTHLVTKYGSCKSCFVEKGRVDRCKHFRKLFEEKFKDRFEFDDNDFINWNVKIKFTCKIHGSWMSKPCTVLRGVHSCPKCNKDSERLSLENFIKRGNKLFNNFYDYSKVEFNAVADYVDIGCPKHGFFKQRADSHLMGNGCLLCSHERKTSNRDEFIRKAKEIHGDKYDYSLVEYRHNKAKVDLICPKHGKFKIKPNVHLSSKSGCPRCRESTGERRTAIALEKLSIPFEREHVIKNYPYRFDFFLPTLDIFIEFHGKQHYEPVGIFGGVKEFNKIKERDRKKVKLLKEMGKPLIVLSYKDLNLNRIEPRLKTLLKRVKKFWLKHQETNEVLAFDDYNEIREYFGISISVDSGKILGILENKGFNKLF